MAKLTQSQMIKALATASGLSNKDAKAVWFKFSLVDAWRFHRTQYLTPAIEEYLRGEVKDYCEGWHNYLYGEDFVVLAK